MGARTEAGSAAGGAGRWQRRVAAGDDRKTAGGLSAAACKATSRYLRATSSGSAAALSAAHPRCRPPHRAAQAPTLVPRRAAAGQPYPPMPLTDAAHSQAAKGSRECRLT